MTRDLAQVLGEYVAAWNEPDADARERLLDGCVADGVVMAPGYAPEAPLIRGREALSDEIGTMIARRPVGRGFHLTRTGEVERTPRLGPVRVARRRPQRRGVDDRRDGDLRRRRGALGGRRTP